jgi:hypothetical protein
MIKLIIVTWLVSALLMGVLSYFIAKSSKRRPVMWFSLGFIFNFLALLVLIFLELFRRKKPG